MHTLKLFTSLSFPVINRERPAIVCQEFALFFGQSSKNTFLLKTPSNRKGGKIWGRFVQKPVIHIHVYMAFIRALPPLLTDAVNSLVKY
jgi:hypothetical protein